MAWRIKAKSKNLLLLEVLISKLLFAARDGWRLVNFAKFFASPCLTWLRSKSKPSFFAWEPGFEPGLMGPRPIVLPLDDSQLYSRFKNFERVMGLAPTTFTLAMWRSTTELHPRLTRYDHVKRDTRWWQGAELNRHLLFFREAPWPPWLPCLSGRERTRTSDLPDGHRLMARFSSASEKQGSSTKGERFL